MGTKITGHPGNRKSEMAWQPVRSQISEKETVSALRAGAVEEGSSGSQWSCVSNNTASRIFGLPVADSLQMPEN